MVKNGQKWSKLPRTQEKKTSKNAKKCLFLQIFAPCPVKALCSYKIVSKSAKKYAGVPQKIPTNPNWMTLRMRDWSGKLVSAPSGAPVTELLAIVHPFRACVLHVRGSYAPNVPQRLQRVTQSTPMPLYWVKVGPKWCQHRSTLRKTVQNGSNRVKIGLQAAGWVPRWY